jgi:hypothetical protein
VYGKRDRRAVCFAWGCQATNSMNSCAGVLLREFRTNLFFRRFFPIAWISSSQDSTSLVILPLSAEERLRLFQFLCCCPLCCCESCDNCLPSSSSSSLLTTTTASTRDSTHAPSHYYRTVLRTAQKLFRN